MEWYRAQLQWSVYIGMCAEMISRFVVTYVCFYIVKSCPLLVAPTNGMKDSNDISCGSTVEFSCYACYELMGNSQLTCLPSQTWSGKEPNCTGQCTSECMCLTSTFVMTFYFCVVKSCQALVAPTNGMKDSDDTFCNSTVKFSCDDCYELMGDSQLTCLPNKTWNGKEPNCTGQCASECAYNVHICYVILFLCIVKSCPPLVAPTNGMKDSDNCNGTVKFSCDDCYELMGDSQLTCLPNKTWNGKEPNCTGQCASECAYNVHICYVILFLCIVKSCPPLVPPTNGMKDSDNCNGTVKFSCDDCYELMGDSQLTCLPNKTWNGTEPNCNGQCKLGFVLK